ncbi:MAG: hypothetical protein OEZ06_02510 [Myxococcales bacterium]|nr:hypothetical protein [Myxococcales bacterium]
MNAIRNYLRKLQSDERGLTTVEYGVVLCLVAAVAVGTWSAFGKDVKTNIGNASKSVNKTMAKAID